MWIINCSSKGYKINMAVFFWYRVKNDASVGILYSSVQWTSHVLQDTRNTRPGITGHPVYLSRRRRSECWSPLGSSSSPLLSATRGSSRTTKSQQENIDTFWYRVVALTLDSDTFPFLRHSRFTHFVVVVVYQCYISNVMVIGDIEALL